jgi:hypothetical protein
MRRCLLKGCEQRFHPRQARQHYCSQICREAARQWFRLEGPTEISGDAGGPTETERPKPALPGAGQEPETTTAHGG